MIIQKALLKNPRFYIFILFLWQLISLLMIVLGGWPDRIIWATLALGALFLIAADPFDGLLFLVLSVPWYVAVPNKRFDTLSVWRIWFAVLFAAWAVKGVWQQFRSGGNRDPLKAASNFLSGLEFFSWDKFLAAFFVIAVVVTATFAKFPMQGYRVAIFWLNIYLPYVVLANVLKTRAQAILLMKYAVWSFTAIILLGYIQLFSTFFTNLDTFWVFWDSFITRLYYGANFAGIALYSNSWFSYTAGRELRMFSIMPDSQSFGYMTMMAVGWATALVLVVRDRVRHWLWSGIRFASLAIILSGTRAVWVGITAPLLVSGVLYRKNVFHLFAKKMFWIFIIILVFFAASPLYNRAFNYLRFGSKFQENFLQRAQSIYDPEDVSNAGRLAIWKDSLKFAARHPQGVGLGNFLISLSGPGVESYQQAAEIHSKRYNLPLKFVSAHNLYIQVLVELGLAGLIAFAVFWVNILHTFVNFLWAHRQAEDVLVFFVFLQLLVVLWILTSAFFDVTLMNDKVLFFFLLSLGLSGGIIRRYEEMKAE